MAQMMGQTMGGDMLIADEVLSSTVTPQRRGFQGGVDAGPSGWEREPEADEELEREGYLVALQVEQTDYELVRFKGNRKKMRVAMAPWMVELMHEIGYGAEAQFAAVRYFDLVLQSFFVEKSHLRRVALACILIAGKMYATDMIPSIDTLLYLAQHCYSPQDILAMEVHVLDAIQWRARVLTPLQFFAYFMSFAVDPAEDSVDSLVPDAAMVGQAVQALNKLGSRILNEICLVEQNMMAFQPSLLASATLMVARTRTGVSPPWPPRFEGLIGYQADQLSKTAGRIIDHLAGAFKHVSSNPGAARPKRISPKASTEVEWTPASPSFGSVSSSTSTR